jgi:hypothetical protein
MVENKLTKVCCFDPGITTGYATGIIEEDGSMGVVSGQAKWEEFVLYLELKRAKPDIIVYERFDYRSESAYGKKGNLGNVELFPRNLIGVLNLYVQEILASGNKIDCYTQMPAQAVGKMPYYSDLKLKADKLYKVANPHANDAVRHLLTWFHFGAGYKYNKKGYRPLA